ncbi:MAG: nickel-binding protein [Acidimicrobiales bacterium]
MTVDTPPAREMTTWIVERFWPGVSAEAVTAAAARLRRSTADLRAAGRSIRYLGSALMPVDEEVLCFFEARSSGDVAAANRLAEVPVDRISLVMTFGMANPRQ